jgi:hypothetical protein
MIKIKYGRWVRFLIKISFGVDAAGVCDPGSV